MNILTIYDHPAPTSFNDNAQGLFSQGVLHKRKNLEILELAALRFAPILTFRGYTGWIDERILLNLVKNLILKVRKGLTEKFTVVWRIRRHTYIYRVRSLRRKMGCETVG